LARSVLAKREAATALPAATALRPRAAAGQHGPRYAFLTQRAESGNVGGMTKKRLLLIASLPVAVVAILGVSAMLPARPGVTRANFDRLKNGMTAADAEQVFGCRATPELTRTFMEHRVWEPDSWQGWVAVDKSIALIQYQKTITRFKARI